MNNSESPGKKGATTRPVSANTMANKMPYHQYSYDVLVENGAPMTIKQMEKKLLEKYPDLKFASGSLSGAMSMYKNVFICFGRKNTFGLKKWETEKENIKGGAIRGIVKEYLSKKKTPMHIYDIYRYVKAFRADTNANSILRNLLAESHSLFVSFGENYIGLKDKRYPENLRDFKELKVFKLTIQILKKYDNWYQNDVIDLYHKEYGFERVQIAYSLYNKVIDNLIQLDEFDRIHIV